MNEILLGIMGTLVTALIFVVKTSMARSDSLLRDRDVILNRSLSVLERAVNAAEDGHKYLIRRLDELVANQERILKKMDA